MTRSIAPEMPQVKPVSGISTYQTWRSHCPGLIAVEGCLPLLLSVFHGQRTGLKAALEDRARPHHRRDAQP